MRHLTTCGRCGGTAEWTGSGWAHYAETPRTSGHAVDPDDGYQATAADEQDPEPCPACHHVHDSLAEEDECGAEVGSGLYGSDGVEVTRYCICTGTAASVGSAPGLVSPDPWMDPDAAAAAIPPPF